MKFLCVLLSVLALSTAHHDEQVEKQIKELQQFMKDPMTKLKTMINEILLTEDGSNFKPDIIKKFTMLDTQICPVESKDCSPADNLLFGCTCRQGFRSLGKICRRKPCELFRNFRDNGLDSLKRFVRSESYEEMYQIFTDFFVIPFSRALCECSGIIGASIKCARRYDGNMFQMSGIDRTEFDNLVNHLDWKTIKKIFLGFVKAGCGEKNGKDCVVELSNMYTGMGTIQENTKKGKNVCLSMLRFAREFEKFEATMGSFDLEKKSPFKSFLNKLLDAYLKVEKKAMCQPSCAAEMKDNFYSCCTKHSYEVLTSKAMRKGYRRLLKNLWDLSSEEKPPNFNKAINKYLSVYNLASFCGDETDVYREKNAQCDAVEA